MKKKETTKTAAELKQEIITTYTNKPKIAKFLHFQNTEGTASNYQTRTREFFEWKKADPETYLQDTSKMSRKKQQEYQQAIENDIIGFLSYLKKDRIIIRKNKEEIRPLLNTQTAIAALKGLLIFNRIRLDDTFWNQLRDKTNGKKVGKTGWLTLEQLREILKNADVETKAFFLMQMTSMSRISEIVTLGFDDIKLDYEYPRITIKAENSKNGEPMRKRISPEAKKYLLDYLKNRDKFIIIREKRTPANRKKLYDPNLIFPMSQTNAEIMWRTVVTNANLYNQDKRTDRPDLGTHALRRYGCTRLENQDLANFFRGERNASNRAYFEYTDEQIDKFYKEKVKNLFVLQTPEEDKYILELHEQELEKQRQDFTLLEMKNKTLHEDNKRLNKRLDQFERIYKERINDDVDPLHFTSTDELTPEQKTQRMHDRKKEEDYEEKAIQEKTRRLKNLIEQNPDRNLEIVYLEPEGTKNRVPQIQEKNKKIETKITDFKSVMDELIKAREETKKLNEEMKEALRKINKKVKKCM